MTLPPSIAIWRRWHPSLSEPCHRSGAAHTLAAWPRQEAGLALGNPRVPPPPVQPQADAKTSTPEAIPGILASGTIPPGPAQGSSTAPASDFLGAAPLYFFVAQRCINNRIYSA